RVAGRCDLRLVERYRNYLMASQVTYVADFDRQVIPWLPLNIQNLIQGVGKLVLAVVIRKCIEGKSTRDLCGVREENVSRITGWRQNLGCAPWVLEASSVRLRGIASRNESLIKSPDHGANLGIHKR